MPYYHATDRARLPPILRYGLVGIEGPRGCYRILTSATPKIREQRLAPPFTPNGVEQGEVDWHP
jgi:hypothetical protein